MRRAILPILATLALAACDYGYTRSSFQQKVAGKTLDEALSAAGKPTRQETRPTGDMVLVYEKKTFDTENMNAKDARVLVSFRKDAKTGQLAYCDIEFVPEI